MNAATAIGVIEGLRLGGITVPTDAIREGIQDARWEGRLEVIKRHPYIVLDGAQNRASAHVLANAVKKIFKYGKLILILGVSKDKDIKGIFEELMPISDYIILTKSNMAARAMEPAKIEEAAEKINNVKDITIASNVEDALKKALSRADKDDLVLVTGSLFVVGEAKSYFAKEGAGECIEVC
jgi:dihydrofolate synthase/folylpolyglutamate synthase